MTPAVEKAKKAKINFDILEYQHDPAATNYGGSGRIVYWVGYLSVHHSWVTNLFYS